MLIRTFVAGDESAQVSIYNEATSGLPSFKPATLDEVRRRSLGPEFDPGTRFFALVEGQPVAYAGFQPQGASARVSHPWCRKGHEALAGPLFEHVLCSARRAGITRVFAAYRTEWTAVRDFFLHTGFQQVREMVNFVMDLTDLPTPAARSGSSISPLLPSDLPAILQMGCSILRVHTQEELRAWLFDNRYFPASSVFVLRSRLDGIPVAVGIVVANSAYAHPRQVDAGMPCFRLGAFGTEGLASKRIHGLFSFLAADHDVNACGLDLMGHAAIKLEDTDVETLAAQVPSDAQQLFRFYRSHFRRQGSFPVFEKSLQEAP
jgi:hypothetical protein